MEHIVRDREILTQYTRRGLCCVQVFDHVSAELGPRQILRLKDQIMRPEELKVGNNYWRWDVQDPDNRRYWHLSELLRVEGEKRMRIVDSEPEAMFGLIVRLADVGIIPYEDTGLWNKRSFLTPAEKGPEYPFFGRLLNVGFSPRWIY